MYGLALMNTSENQAEALPYFYQAREESLRLGIDDWGAVYPGNNPEHWGIGLKEFQGIIEKNIALLE
jgi:hypothetical protein